MKTEVKKIIEDGMLIDSYPCDINKDGELESNGAQEKIYLYNGVEYYLIFDWDNNLIN